MQPMNAAQQANALYRAHGAAAEAEVARKIRACTQAGQADQAEDWRQIRTALRERRA